MNSLKTSAMTLTVIMLLATSVSRCKGAPQRRNWTPQAMLYLKGAQGRRSSVSMRAGREDKESSYLVTRSQINRGVGMALVATSLLNLLQQAIEKGGINPRFLYYQDH